MKKLVFLFAAVLIICFGMAQGVNAEEIKVEGENFSDINFPYQIKSGDSEFSESAFVWNMIPASENPCQITYKVTVDKAGAYNLKAVTTYLEMSYTSDYYVAVNGGTPVPAKEDYKLLQSISSAAWPNLFGKYDLGLVELNEGENTIVFELLNDDIRWDQLQLVWIDYFTLEYVPFDIYRLKAYESSNVFTRSQKVEYDVMFAGKSETEDWIDFDVKNFWKQSVLSGRLAITPGSGSLYLNLGTMQVGWYELEVRRGDTKLNAYFAVTHNESEYTKEETPFAVDVALGVLRNPADSEKYVRAAKLAGIQWIRDRFNWAAFQEAQGVYSESYERGPKLFSEAGIDVSLACTVAPVWSVGRGFYPENYLNVYDAYYNAAKHYGDMVDMWEIWNEQDTMFASEPADEYSAMAKVISIAVADAGHGQTTIGGLTVTPEGDVGHNTFADMCMLNGLLDYTSVFNFHAYGQKETSNQLPTHPSDDEERFLNEVYSYGDGSLMPMWITEGGLPRPFSTETNEMSFASQKEVVQGCTIDIVQSLSLGTAKHFWFLLCPYKESTEFGVFNIDNEPFPCYAAYANLIYQLRVAKYKGVMTDLPEGAEGHIFDNGKHDVMVLWADHPLTYYPETQGRVTVADVMGQEYTTDLSEGIPLSIYPVYVHFDGEVDPALYVPHSYEFRPRVMPTFNQAQKVVMCPRFYGENYDIPRVDGYTVYGGRSCEFYLEVYNLNDTEITADIHAQPESDWFAMEQADQTITVPPKSMEKLKFVINVTDNVVYDATQLLTFTGTVNGEEMSPSVARIIARSPYDVEPVYIFEASNDASKWDTSNTGAGTNAKVTNSAEGEGVEFLLHYDNASAINGWSYPLFYPENTEDLADSSGLCFTIQADQDITGWGMNVFADFTDGRRYFLGNEAFIDVKKGVRQVKVPWKRLVMFSSPLGAIDVREFDPTLIKDFELGGNKQTMNDQDPKFTLTNIGYYTDNTEVLTTNNIKINLTGVETGAVYKQGEVPTGVAEWNEGLEYEVAGVRLEGQEYEKFQVDGNKMTIDFSGLERGVYRFMVYLRSSAGYMYKTYTRFTVE